MNEDLEDELYEQDPGMRGEEMDGSNMTERNPDGSVADVDQEIPWFGSPPELDLVETLEDVFGLRNVFVLETAEDFERAQDAIEKKVDKWGDSEPNIDQLSDYDLANLETLSDTANWWTARFVRLYLKSDLAHRARLRLAFPNICRHIDEKMGYR